MFWKCGTVQIFRNDSNNQNLTQEEIKRRLSSGNACYHSVQKLLSSHLLCKHKNWNILWHVNAFPGNGSINTPIRACNNRTNVYSLLLGDSAPLDWRDSYYVTCFLCGLHYATVELCFLLCPCHGYVTQVCLQLKRMQEGLAVDSTRTRMEHVLRELWRMSTEWLTPK
jgi:hypothetical protein